MRSKVGKKRVVRCGFQQAIVLPAKISHATMVFFNPFERLWYGEWLIFKNFYYFNIIVLAAESRIIYPGI